MARATLILLLGLGLAAGCTTPETVSGVSPRPNFSAPVVSNSKPAVGSVRPVPPKTAVIVKPPVVIAKSTVPKGWLPDVAPRPWRYIVIHHSDTPTGSAAKFDAAHKAKGWDELGYHFVIGNGTETGDGQVEIGPRWPKQKWGAHDKTPDNRYNDYGIGICLVGNFEETRPTAAQMQSTAKLVAYLMKTYKIAPANVVGHGDTKATDCPGKNMSVASVRKMAEQILADAGWTPDAKTVAAGEELLKSSPQ